MTDLHPHETLRGTTFNPKAFLGRAETGKTIEKYGKNQEIFTQGETADSVFYIQKGKVKITVLSEHGKEAVVGILTRDSSSAKPASMGHTCAPHPVMRWKSA
jgi:CRP/FNR family cyclic AMP-dependent transcriptional regulator